MAHAHPHSHSHGEGASRGRLRAAFGLTLLLVGVELGGGLLSHSLALLSDAGHVLTDLLALGLAWFAAAQAERQADASRTFGYHRVGILAALTNAVTLIAIVAWIAYEAWDRLRHPQAVTPWLVIAAAAVGIAINVSIGLGLHQADQRDLNVRAALLHVIGDVAASAAVVVGGVVILATGQYAVDAVVSLLIAVLIAVGSLRLLRDALGILLEATPRGVDMDRLVEDLRAVPGVKDVHDLHVWSIAGAMHALSCHVTIDDLPPSASTPILDQITHTLREHYAITHTTVQFECVGCAAVELYCKMDAARRQGEREPETAQTA